MKRLALLRKNALFVGTARGGETVAILSTITSTFRRHKINPQVSLTRLPTSFQKAPSSRIDEWLPDRCKAAHIDSATPPTSPRGGAMCSTNTPVATMTGDAGRRVA
jgi:transposase